MNRRKAAKGQPCTARIPYVCCLDWSTTVLAHIRRGNPGIGRKPDDKNALFACAHCHDAIDGRRTRDRYGIPIDKDAIERAIERGMRETNERIEAMT